jgi:hypothetical protein
MLRRRDERSAGGTFEIRFESGPVVEPWEGGSIALGRILLGDFHEPFEASLEHWAVADYEARWQRAAQRLVDGAGPALFLTSYHGATAGYHDGWLAWREGVSVIFHHRLLLHERLPRLEDGAYHIGFHDRERVSPHGAPISEWDVSLAAVEDFLARAPARKLSRRGVTKC